MTPKDPKVRAEAIRWVLLFAGSEGTLAQFKELSRWLSQSEDHMREALLAIAAYQEVCEMAACPRKPSR